MGKNPRYPCPDGPWQSWQYASLASTAPWETAASAPLVAAKTIVRTAKLTNCKIRRPLCSGPPRGRRFRYGLMSFMIWTKWKALLEVTEIGRDRFDLRLGQAVRNRLHDGGGVRFFRILTPFFAPVRQFLEDVVRKLTC